ncbi:hypothetical protein [Amycolatopsis rubida]|uniref:Uncharacterized protein n=1 Tax=Amycolatopsis rubida TaxID=112413 RepID=A0A1I6BME4_9PSEU|nr:hypothetical protein [Amycolatopsis rubida]SFQ82090.1 hypothetical protein SAMN05421854_1336 [Amycolatopsis rubida]
MTAPDAQVPWVTRLSYELSEGLRADVPVFLGGTVAAGLAYIPGYPEVGEGTLARIAEAEITDDLREATYRVRGGLEAMRGFGDPCGRTCRIGWTRCPTTRRRRGRRLRWTKCGEACRSHSESPRAPVPSRLIIGTAWRRRRSEFEW